MMIFDDKLLETSRIVIVDDNTFELHDVEMHDGGNSSMIITYSRALDGFNCRIRVTVRQFVAAPNKKFREVNTVWVSMLVDDGPDYEFQQHIRHFYTRAVRVADEQKREADRIASESLGKLFDDGTVPGWTCKKVGA